MKFEMAISHLLMVTLPDINLIIAVIFYTR